MLWDPTLPEEPGPTEPGVESSSAGKPTHAPPERGRRAGACEVDLSQANIAQTSGQVKYALLRLLERYRHVFPANPKIVPACNRAKLQLPLVNNSCSPHEAKQRRYSPE